MMIMTWTIWTNMLGSFQQRIGSSKIATKKCYWPTECRCLWFCFSTLSWWEKQYFMNLISSTILLLVVLGHILFVFLTKKTTGQCGIIFEFLSRQLSLILFIRHGQNQLTVFYLTLPPKTNYICKDILWTQSLRVASAALLVVTPPACVQLSSVD